MIIYYTFVQLDYRIRNERRGRSSSHLSSERISTCGM